MTNPLKQRIKTPAMIPAAWVELGSPDIAEILVRHGWDTIVIDGEHGRGELEDWVHIARAVEACGATPILRLPEGNDTLIKRALDRGFRNFIVPMVNTREQAEQVVSAFFYPLKGRRGYAAPIVRGSHWGSRPDYGRVESFDDLVIIVQCEHVDAVHSIDDIMAVEGIDMIFIGPNDLAASAGHLEHMDHPEVQALIETVEAAAKRHNMPLATVRSPGRDWKDLDDRGFRLVAGVNDISMLIESAQNSLTEATGQIAAAVKTY